ncbi:ion transport 2 domain protein [Halogeometricum pallidum JCM 14848]|uniref:Ion transport 2 domain protein n=1 Tax=Halogeometricum pallidum JCM 14848 TaxID=1227487 RepID=M0DIG3_HALPD|nr:potassium channel family protein [Halogeometricum pallidum]ELZ35296.1 ion transport 2 domain protein [Halogeometricum pallidum JCM 14848]
MNPVYLVAGALSVLAVTVDVLWTTLWVQGGAGPLTSRLMEAIWTLFRRAFGDRHRPLTLAGPTILVVGLLVWIALLWGGWMLLFAGGDAALVDTRQNGPIDWAERFYFVGYTLFTMGNGDFTPNGGVWQVATALTTASGMLFVTLMVTYILSVLDAVTQKRAFASGVSGLGDRSHEILRNAWNGEEFRGLDLPLNSLASDLDTLVANHKAYPVVHHFHSERARNAPAVSVVHLDELLTLLRFGTSQEGEPADVIVDSARSSVEDYLSLLEEAFVEPADDPPPAPSIESLRDAGIPAASDEEFADSLAEIGWRRRQLRGLIESDAREWPNRE